MVGQFLIAGPFTIVPQTKAETTMSEGKQTKQIGKQGHEAEKNRKILTYYLLGITCLRFWCSSEIRDVVSVPPLSGIRYLHRFCFALSLAAKQKEAGTSLLGVQHPGGFILVNACAQGVWDYT